MRPAGEAVTSAPMRVLLLSDWMSNRGGAESYILSLRDELRAQGDDVRLLTCGSVDPIEADITASGSDSVVAQAFLQVANPFAATKVRDTVRDFKPHVALVSHFAYHLSPSVFRALDSVPTVASMMDYKVVCPLGTKLLRNGSTCDVRAGFVCCTNGCVGIVHWLRDVPRYAGIRRGLSTASRIVCPSLAVQRELLAVGIEATVIPLGASCIPVAQGVPARDPLFVYTGRLAREKGVALLLASLARCRVTYPAARVRVIGDGPLRRELEQLATMLGVADAVEFTGWVGESAVDGYRADAWACVCPSLWAEPFGLAAIGSTLAGVPVIASDSGGFAETVEHGVNGLRFRAGDVAALTEAMLSIASGDAFPAHRLEAAKVARAAEQYGMRQHVNRVRALFAEISA